MSDLREQLARQIREALGKANDPDLPVVIIVRELANRISALEEQAALDKTVAEAVMNLPVEYMVERDDQGEPFPVGYFMQAQGEWDNVSQALRAAGYLKEQGE